MKKVRIIERILPNGGINFVIQTKSLWLWFDEWIFTSYKEALENICYYDGTKSIEKVLYQK